MKPSELSIILLSIILMLVCCNEAKYMQGKRTYDIMCGDCHMEDGSGVEDLYPALLPLSKEVAVDEIPCIIKHGIYNETSLIKMPPNPSLKPVDITNIINYLLNDLNKHKKEFTLKQINELLEDCSDHNKNLQ